MMVGFGRNDWIRTNGALRPDSLANCCLNPLSHASELQPLLLFITTPGCCHNKYLLYVAGCMLFQSDLHAFYGGGCKIRTHAAFRPNSFQNCLLRPLGQASIN